MSHVLKLKEWQDTTTKNRWFCADVEELGKGSGYWWYPARMLEMPLTDYIALLKEYGAEGFEFYPRSCFLYFYWADYAKVHKFVLYINKEARKRNYVIC